MTFFNATQALASEPGIGYPLFIQIGIEEEGCCDKRLYYKVRLMEYIFRHNVFTFVFSNQKQ